MEICMGGRQISVAPPLLSSISHGGGGGGGGGEGGFTGKKKVNPYDHS